MKFKSKKDWWLAIIIWGAMLFAMGSAIYGLFTTPAGVMDLLIIIPCAFFIPIFILWLWFTTEYILTEKSLIIRYGPFKKEISLHTITSVRKTSNPLSSPALSLKRIEISYEKYNMVLISPKDRDNFIKLLMERFPNIKEISK